MLYDMQCSTDACTRMYLCLRSYLIMGRDILIFAMAMSVGCSAALAAQAWEQGPLNDWRVDRHKVPIE